jgi:dTDP-4-amino-4,6-dideoxygalactose transaminase
VTLTKVRYSPLRQQFSNVDDVLADIRRLIVSGDFTLGAPVRTFEAEFSELMGVKHAIGVGTGTDALKLPLKAIGIGPSDHVLTCANTFIATVGAIAELGASPLFIDCTDTFCMDLDRLEDAITPRTKAIMPVHLTGEVVDMPRLMEISVRRGIPVVEDACQSMLSELDGRKAGTWGVAAGFSMHPLKLINVWGDAGVIITNDSEMDRRLRLLRNHGLRGRDEVEVLGCNTRLDSLQAIVASWMVRQAQDIAIQRGERAAYYDQGFSRISGIRIPPRRHEVKHTYLLYILFADRRDELLCHCLDQGIEAKVHYPVPLYRQPGLAQFGYRAGDFPVTDRHAREMITFPVDQHLTREEQDYVIRTVAEFYGETADA